jgi:hypothetical protein
MQILLSWFLFLVFALPPPNAGAHLLPEAGAERTL